MAKKNPYYDASKPHHTEFGFQNLEPVIHHPQDLKRWREERKRQSLPKPPQQGYAQFVTDWWQAADFGGQQDALWWLGHASLLLRVGGKLSCSTRYSLAVLRPSIFMGQHAEPRLPPV